MPYRPQLDRATNVELVFLNKSLGKSPEDDLLLQRQGIIAEYERAKFMERSRRGKRHAAQSGSLNVMSCAPFGYRYVSVRAGGGKARFEPNAEQARVVQRIFSWIGRDRCSLNEVCRRLRKAGDLTASGSHVWSKQAVWHILQNPAYVGRAAYGKTRMMMPRTRKTRPRPPRGRPAEPRRSNTPVANAFEYLTELQPTRRAGPASAAVDASELSRPVHPGTGKGVYDGPSGP
jgi:site-specific DNA recombinase